MEFDLDAPQFSTQELLACTALSHDLFKQRLQRGVLSLKPAGSIGRGKRPLYTGADVIQTGAIHYLTSQGFLSAKVTLAYRMGIAPRLLAWQTGLAPLDQPHNRSVLFSVDPVTGEVFERQFAEGEEDPFAHPDLPDVVILFRTDRFIIRMIERMQRVKAGGTPDAPPAARSPLEQDLDYLEAGKRVERDASGNRVLIGLTEGETGEYISLSNLSMLYRAGTPVFETPEEAHAADERVEQLQEKHDAAMFARSVTT